MKPETGNRNRPGGLLGLRPFHPPKPTTKIKRKIELIDLDDDDYPYFGKEPLAARDEAIDRAIERDITKTGTARKSTRDQPRQRSIEDETRMMRDEAERRAVELEKDAIRLNKALELEQMLGKKLLEQLGAEQRELPDITFVPPPKRRKLRSLQCSLCIDNKPTSSFPEVPHHGATRDDHLVCYACWEQHLNCELERTAWNQHSCPLCSEVLEEAEIKDLDKHFEIKVHAKIVNKSLKAWAEQEAAWVNCPSSTCSFGGLMGDGHIFTCQVCSYRYCTSCEVPMHEDESCTDFKSGIKRNKEKLEEEKQSAAKVKQISKPCPGCKRNLDKYEGCDHITCQWCRHQFCWRCFVPYVGPGEVFAAGNSAHKKSCSHYRK